MCTITNLHKRIEELESENRLLRAEIKRLKEGFDLPLEHVAPEETISEPVHWNEKEEIPIADSFINKYCSPEEKIALFMSLFRGRTDVYAKRCYSKKRQCGYYIPACKNEWVRNVCDRARTKCKDCDKRELLPLTKDVINSHLRNKDENGTGIVGIYPLLSDETCLFLAIDFDAEKWQKDISVFRAVCKELNIPVAIERSRSGNGAHAWFLFEEPIPAVTARKLGNMLLTKAMSIRHDTKPLSKPCTSFRT